SCAGLTGKSSILRVECSPCARPVFLFPRQQLEWLARARSQHAVQVPGPPSPVGEHRGARGVDHTETVKEVVAGPMVAAIVRAAHGAIVARDEIGGAPRTYSHAPTTGGATAA